MSKHRGINLLLISILLTTIGSIFKIIGQVVVSEVLLWAGMILCVVAIGIIIRNLLKRNNGVNV